MKGKKKNVIKVIIVLLVIGGIFYFAQPWIVYYTGPPQWTYERLCQSVQSGSYWNSARGRALDVDGHLDELKTETVFLRDAQEGGRGEPLCQRSAGDGRRHHGDRAAGAGR